MTEDRNRADTPRRSTRRGCAVATLMAIGLAFAGCGEKKSEAQAPAIQYDRKLESVLPGLGLRIQNAMKPWSFADKAGVFRFEVRPGDGIPGDGPDAKERSELYSANKMAIGRTYRIRFSLLVEPGAKNSAAWMTLAQIQSSFDKGEAGHSPPLSIGLKGDRMTIGTNEATARISKPADIHFIRRYVDKRDLVRDKWYRFVILVRTGPAPDGRLLIRRDGAKLVDVKGQVGFNDVVGPYFKVGVYRAASPERFAIRVKDLSVAPVG